jgi:hypothetical protein
VGTLKYEMGMLVKAGVPNVATFDVRI